MVNPEMTIKLTPDMPFARQINKQETEIKKVDGAFMNHSICCGLETMRSFGHLKRYILFVCEIYENNYIGKRILSDLIFHWCGGKRC